MAEQRSDDRSQARSEAAVLLGVDIDHLSAADSLRVDMVSALRLVIDSEQASVLSGSSADLGKLNVAVQSLIALLPGRELPAPESDHPDPRVKMWEIYRTMRERGEVPPEGWHQHRINRLELENARLRAQLVAGGLIPTLPDASMQKGNRRDHGDLPIDPTEVVPPGEWRGERYARPGPDDPAPRSAAIIEGRPNPPAASAPAKPPRPAWEDWLDAQQGGVR
jgi:hypothetical protein